MSNERPIGNPSGILAPLLPLLVVALLALAVANR
jgi:hypothetical protein